MATQIADGLGAGRDADGSELCQFVKITLARLYLSIGASGCEFYCRLMPSPSPGGTGEGRTQHTKRPATYRAGIR